MKRFRILLFMVSLMVICCFGIRTEAKKGQISQTEINAKPGRSYKLVLKNVDGNKVEWNWTDECIRVQKIKKGKNRSTIYFKAVKDGECLIWAEAGKKDYDCTVYILKKKPKITFAADKYVYKREQGMYYISANTYTDAKMKYCSNKTLIFRMRTRVQIADTTWASDTAKKFYTGEKKMQFAIVHYYRGKEIAYNIVRPEMNRFNKGEVYEYEWEYKMPYAKYKHVVINAYIH